MMGVELKSNKIFGHGLWPSLILCPALCFFQSLSQIRKGDIRASWAIPFIMGLFAYLFPPFSDFARWENAVGQLLDRPLSEVVLLFGDVILPAILYTFMKVGIPVEIFRFLYTFFAYFLVTDIFIDLCKNNKLSPKRIFVVWVFLFMQIEFFAYIDNIRTIFVRIGLAYCAYQYYVNSHNKYRYYSLLLSFVHFSYFPIILLFFISKHLHLSFSRTFRMLLSLLLLTSSFLPQVIDISGLLSSLNFGDIINRKIISYTEGEWGTGGENLTNVSTAYQIYKTLSAFCSYWLILIFCKMRFRGSFNTFTCLLGLLCLCCTSIPVLSGRYIGFFFMIAAFDVLMGYIHNKVNENDMLIYLLLCLFNTVLNTYANWNCMVNGHVIFLLLPMPLALFQIYDFDVWRLSHLSDDFNQIINGNFLSR